MAIGGRHFIERAKVADYLLNVDHERGGSKARFFTSLGFNLANPQAFMDALDEHARSRPTVRETPSPFGTKRVIRCSITSPDGRNPCIVSVWEQTPVGDDHRLVTAYPAK